MSSMPLFLNYESGVIAITGMEASLPITANSSKDHGISPGFPWLQGLQTSTWPLAIPQKMSLNIVPGDNMGHGPHHGLWLQQGPRISIQPQHRS